MHTENVDIGVFGDAFLDVGVEADCQLFALFLGLGKVNYFRALGLRHGGFGACRKLSTTELRIFA